MGVFVQFFDENFVFDSIERFDEKLHGGIPLFWAPRIP